MSSSSFSFSSMAPHEGQMRIATQHRAALETRRMPDMQSWTLLKPDTMTQYVLCVIELNILLTKLMHRDDAAHSRKSRGRRGNREGEGGRGSKERKGAHSMSTLHRPFNFFSLRPWHGIRNGSYSNPACRHPSCRSAAVPHT